MQYTTDFFNKIRIYLLKLTMFYCEKESVCVCVCIYNNSNTNELLLFNNKQVEIFDEEDINKTAQKCISHLLLCLENFHGGYFFDFQVMIFLSHLDEIVNLSVFTF